MKKIILISLLACSGCAMVNGPSREERRQARIEQEKEREKEEAEEEQRLARSYEGKTEDDIVIQFGAPTQIQNVGSFKILIYFDDLGTTTTGRGTAGYFNGVSVGRSNSESTPHFNQKRFYFKDGRVVKYDQDEQ